MYNSKGGSAVCPLNGSCLTPGVVYDAKVTRLDHNKTEFYTEVKVDTFIGTKVSQL